MTAFTHPAVVCCGTRPATAVVVYDVSVSAWDSRREMTLACPACVADVQAAAEALVARVEVEPLTAAVAADMTGLDLVARTDTVARVAA